MWMATTEDQFAPHLPAAHLQQTPTAPEAFSHPLDVVAAKGLPKARKREILAAWASDASAVKDRPTLRWLLGTPAPIPLEDIFEALRRLDDAGGDRPAAGGGAPVAFAEPVRIQVEPCGDGWAMRCAGVANEQLFRSGRTAERAARRLGERLAAAGRWAEIHVRLRNGGLAGRFVCAPA